jgi:glycine cleavage system aminomethyltransferase T
VYNLGDDGFELVSGMPVLNWVHYQAQAAGYDVAVERDDPTPYNPKGARIKYRFQLSGPRAWAIFDAAAGGAPYVPFFRTARVTIAGRDVLALGHGMAAHRSVELSGPYEDMDAVRDAILAAGAPHGLLRGGTQAYFSATLESGWIPYPLPGIYTGDDLRGFREWLPADGWEGNQQLGGSFRSPDIEDYYVTPWDLGYGHILKFDHDFIGREALEELAGRPHRSKVTLVWNTDDVLRVYASQFGSGPRYKSLDFPLAVFGWPQYDEVRTPDGRLAGLSNQCGYSGNEAAVLSLAMVDHDVAQPGTQLELTWGEPVSTRKPHVERHEATRIRVTVAPAPYKAVVREMTGSTAS